MVLGILGKNMVGKTLCHSLGGLEDNSFKGFEDDGIFASLNHL